MAKLLCQLHWDDKTETVVKTYQVLSTGPKDSIELVTRDADPFIIKTTNARLAKKLGLTKASNADGKDLYQVKKILEIAPQKIEPVQTGRAPISPTPKPASLPPWLKLKCGGLKDGKFDSWGGVGPDGFYTP